MKKLTALFLALCMACALIACGSSAKDNSQSGGQAETPPPSETENQPGETTDTPSEEGWKPEKAINIIVPYEAGGNSDIPTRIFAKYMAEYTDVEINITNITGAGGRTGAQEAMNADPDGYTYLLQSSGFVMQYALGLADFSYQDFENVGYFLDSSMAIAVSADSPYETLDDLISAAAAAPGTIKFGTVTGTLPLFAAIYLEEQNGVSFNKVDLGTGAKAPELLSKRIDCYADGFGALKEYVDSGDFRCLAVFGGTSIPGYEDIPTLDKLGYEDFSYLKQNFGLWAPKGTSAEAVAYVNDLIRQAAENPECIAEMEALCYKPMYTTVEEYTSTLEKIYGDFQAAAATIAG